MSENEDDWAEYKLEKKRRQHRILRRNQVRSTMMIAGVRDLLLHASCDSSLPLFVRQKCISGFLTLSTIKKKADPWTSVWLPNEEEIPSNFECPITKNFMRDPVMTSDGHTYDRSAIEKWFAEGHLTSPSTGCQLATLLLAPNHQCRKGMEMWREKNAGRKGLKKHVVTLCGSVLSAKDNNHVHQIIDQIKTLVSGKGVVAQCGPILSHDDIQRLSAVASSIVHTIGKKRKKEVTDDDDDGDDDETTTTKVMTSIHALEDQCNSSIADYQRQYQCMKMLETARLKRASKSAANLTTTKLLRESTQADLNGTEEKLKKVEREYKRLQEKLKEAQKRKKKADQLMENEMKSLSELQSLGHHIEKMKSTTKKMLTEVDADPDADQNADRVVMDLASRIDYVHGSMKGGTSSSLEGTVSENNATELMNGVAAIMTGGGKGVESALGKRKFVSTNDGDSSDNSEDEQAATAAAAVAAAATKKNCQDEAGQTKKQRTTTTTTSEQTEEDMNTSKWLFEKGHNNYWGLHGHSRNLLKGQLMIEVAENKGDPAARLFCMFFGWNGYGADPDRARALYKDMQTNGSQSFVLCFPIKPKPTTKERFESLQMQMSAISGGSTTPPVCLQGHTMSVSSFSRRMPGDSESSYSAGFICDLCDGRSKKGHCGASRERWHCSMCHFDCCFVCRPKDGNGSTGPGSLQESFGDDSGWTENTFSGLINPTSMEVEEIVEIVDSGDSSGDSDDSDHSDSDNNSDSDNSDSDNSDLE